jgi:hypothetical protein
VGVDSVGVDEGELGEGLFPASSGLAFDEVPVGFAFSAPAKAGFFGAVAGSFVFDGAVRFPRFPGGSRSWSDWAKGGAEL